MLLYFSAIDRFLLTNEMGLRMLLSGALSLGQFVPLLSCSRPTPSSTQDASLSMYTGLVSSTNSIPASSFVIDFALSNSFWHVAFQVHYVLTAVNCLSDSQTSVVLRENFLK